MAEGLHAAGLSVDFGEIIAAEVPLNCCAIRFSYGGRKMLINKSFDAPDSIWCGGGSLAEVVASREVSQHNEDLGE